MCLHAQTNKPNILHNNGNDKDVNDIGNFDDENDDDDYDTITRISASGRGNKIIYLVLFRVTRTRCRA